MNGTLTFARTRSAVWRRIDDRLVLIADVGAPSVECLSAPASATWNLLERPLTVGELAVALAASFGEAPSDVTEHVERIVDTLERRGWIVRGNGDG